MVVCWAEIEVDLTRFAGKRITVALVNFPNDWQFEAAYWAAANVDSR